MPRKAHKPDLFHRRQVEAMAGYGVPELDIARVVGIDPKTLRRHYREELDTGRVKAAAKVAESLFRKATTDGSQSVTAAIFWLETQAGWKETTAHEIAGRNGGPIETSDVSLREIAKSILAVLETTALRADPATTAAEGS